MTGQVAGKVALVTGGASGIGAAVAELLAREGASVVVTDIDDLKGPEVVAGIKKAGHEAVFLHQDVTSEPRWDGSGGRRRKALSAGSTSWFPMPASEFRCRRSSDMSLEDWRRQTAINLDGVFLSVKHCLPLMRRTGGGSIIMMSSLAGLRGAPTLAGYCATKGGVRLFAKAIAMECASVGDGIRVNSVHPGIIDTPIWGKIPTEAAGQRTERADRSGRARQTGDAARPRRPRRRDRQRRVVSGVRCIALRDRNGTRDRRRHECGRRGAAGREAIVIPGIAQR